MLKSVPVWSILFFTFSTTWGVYFVITISPTYIANALGYKISATGYLSALLYLARSISAFLFGSIGDFLIKKKIPVKYIRKIGCIISHVLPGVLLIALTHPGNTPMSSVALLVIAMFLNGGITITSLANPHDLTKNFAGTLVGIVTSFGTISGLILPTIVAYFTKANETNVQAWAPVFYIGATVYILCAGQFIIFGSTEIQEWNNLEEHDDLKMKTNELLELKI